MMLVIFFYGLYRLISEVRGVIQRAQSMCLLPCAPEETVQFIRKSAQLAVMAHDSPDS